MNLSTILYQISKDKSKEMALIEEDKYLSYNKLWNDIEKLAKAFWKIGLKKDDKVAVILPNCKEFILSFFALLRIDAIAVPLKPAFTAFELKEIFQDCSPVAIISTPSFLDKVVHEDEELLDRRIVIALGRTDNSLNSRWEKFFTFGQLYEIGKDENLPENTKKNNQIASINYTYRGYGYPLGVVLSHDNYYHSATAFKNLLKPLSVNCALLFLPMAHIFSMVGSIIFPLSMGATIVIVNSIIPSHIFRTIDEFQVDYILGTPTIYSIFLKNYNKEKYRLDSIRHAISGGSFLPMELHHRVKEAMGLSLMQGYGLTECVPAICNALGSKKIHSLGVSWNDNVEIKIVDENDRQLPANKTGEILIKGPVVMDKYYGKKEITDQVIKDGWFYTGDYGRLDEDGYLYFEGLKKKIIKIGGNTVDLKEVEKVLLTHPAVCAVKLYAKSDSLWGHLLTAEIFLESNRDIQEKDIKSFCKERIASYKIPKTIIIDNKYRETGQGPSDCARRASESV
ncbi:MAG: AMP-binding protein [Candidatus Omnitrophota bacterium]|nr:MAG: AMP-binding protein [Candidatus Omnitrophota bacterium]